MQKHKRVERMSLPISCYRRKLSPRVVLKLGWLLNEITSQRNFDTRNLVTLLAVVEALSSR